MHAPACGCRHVTTTTTMMVLTETLETSCNLASASNASLNLSSSSRVQGAAGCRASRLPGLHNSTQRQQRAAPAAPTHRMERQAAAAAAAAKQLAWHKQKQEAKTPEQKAPTTPPSLSLMLLPLCGQSRLRQAEQAPGGSSYIYPNDVMIMTIMSWHLLQYSTAAPCGA